MNERPKAAGTAGDETSSRRIARRPWRLILIGAPLLLLVASMSQVGFAPSAQDGPGRVAAAGVDEAQRGAEIVHTPLGDFIPDPPAYAARVSGRPDQGGVTSSRTTGMRGRDKGAQDAGTGFAGAAAGLRALERRFGLAKLSTKRLQAEQDTFVSEARKDDNFGRDDLLYVGGPEGYGKSYSYLWFEMDELPADQAVDEAKLELYLREAGPAGDEDRTLSAYKVRIKHRGDDRRCDASWDERDLTWDDQPDYDDDALDREDVSTSRGRFSLKFTKLAQRWRVPEWNLEHECNGGVVIHGDDRDGSFRGFDSSEASNEPELRLSHFTDDKAPNGEMKALPTYITAPDPGSITEATVPLAWEGSDPMPGTGIDRFQLFGKANEGQWQLLAPEVRTYSGSFKAENGLRYGFAIYPVDPAGNMKAATESGTAFTHVDFDPPVATVDKIPAYMPGPFELTFTAYDLPNTPGKMGSGVSHYDLHYNIGGGSWGLLASPLRENHFFFEAAEQGLHYQFRVIGVDFAGHRELEGEYEAETRIDGLPPVVSFASADSIGRERFAVRWSSVDPGLSGTVSYDIQVQTDGGPWRDWQIATSALSFTFEGETGHVYGFRARARDLAGNQGVYPLEAQMKAATFLREDLTFRAILPILAQQ
jgi:hypothetical protein